MLLIRSIEIYIDYLLQIIEKFEKTINRSDIHTFSDNALNGSDMYIKKDTDLSRRPYGSYLS